MRSDICTQAVGWAPGPCVRSQASGDQGMVQREVKDSAVKAYFLSHPWTFALAASLPGLPPSRALPGQLPLGTTSEKPSWVLRLE